jgi:hypothetical protein
MLCKNVLSLLSEFYDEVLDAKVSVQVTQHLGQCGPCRKELESLSILQGKLKSLKGIQAPEFLGSLVEHRITEFRQNSWRRSLRDELERMWSIIRTTESTWYITKVLGTVMTSLFFFMICGSNIPLPLQSDPEMGVYNTDPAISEQYLNNLGASLSQPGKDDSVSVRLEVDSSGSATIQKVIERPHDPRLLSNVKEMITSTHCRPASKNGKAVSSHLILIFNWISVYGKTPDGD